MGQRDGLCLHSLHSGIFGVTQDTREDNALYLVIRLDIYKKGQTHAWNVLLEQVQLKT